MPSESLADFKNDGGGYVGPDGCWWEDKWSIVQCHMLDFCACGSPEDNLVYVKEALENINAIHTNEEPFDVFWPKYKARELEIHGNERSAYFFFYWADHSKYTEHGGSVPGWLTPKGIQLLADINEALNEFTDTETTETL